MRCTRPWLAAFSIALLLSSCAPKRSEILLDTKTTDANTLISLVQEHQNKLQSVVGKGTVTFESPELAGTAAFELALKKPDSLLVTFEGPFGIDLGTLFISREKYLMYNSMENKVVTGTPSAAAIRSIIPFDLTLDQVVGAFSGSFPFPSDPQSLQTYSVDDDRFLLVFRCGSNSCKYWVDNRTVLVTKYEMRDEHDELILDAVSSSFAEDGAASAPKRIRIRFPSQERQLSVSYSSISLNDPDPSFTYSIPSNARTVIR
jgi:outer membrane lipoprotein-sorting protein